jgi:Protein of unknown function (DUF2997)
MTKTIEIMISPKGETTVQTKGFTGSECRLASQFVEEALGKRTAEQFTSEFYNAQQVDQDLRQSS